MTARSTALVQFVGQEDEPFDLIVNGELIASIPTSPIATALIELERGPNEVCVAVPDSEGVEPVSKTCRQLVYLP